MLKAIPPTIAALALVGTVLVATPAAAQGTDVTAFCDATLAADRALGALGDGRPNPRQVDRATAALTAVESTAPPEIATNVQSIATITRTALESGEDPSSDPTFQEDVAVVDAFRYASCGYQTADVTLREYEFSGLPKSFTTGNVAIKLTNTGTEVHEMAIALLKTSNSFRSSLALPEHDQADRLRYVAQAIAPPGETAYLFVEFTRSGRYGAACHIPVGTTSMDELEEMDMGEHGSSAKPHWREGMVETFRVTKA